MRARLHGSGARFRIHFRPLEGSSGNADIAFPSKKLAVLIDGCFWHRCPTHATQPQSNAAWWARKLEGNVQRDRRFDAALALTGWRVFRFWEHEGAEAIVAAIQLALAPAPGDQGTWAMAVRGGEVKSAVVGRASAPKARHRTRAEKVTSRAARK